mgnify:CR=1 FL=1
MKISFDTSHPKIEAFRLAEARRYNEKYFKEDYWKEDLLGKRGNRGLSYDDPRHEKRFSFLANTFITTFPEMRSVLDAGCGPGLLLEALAAHNIKATGVDVSDVATASADRFLKSRGREVDVRTAPLTGLPFLNDTFDYTICLDVLEHMIFFDIPLAIDELSRVTKRCLICSINLDNPYQYHPSILSRDSWIVAFQVFGGLNPENDAIEKLVKLSAKPYPEYTWFVLQKGDSTCLSSIQSAISEL